MESKSVFAQLRSLARHLEQGSVELKDKVEDPRKYADDVSSANAYKQLQDMKKSVHSLKDEARDQLGNLQLSNSWLHQLLELLPQVMEAQRQALAHTEEYLTQYGYTPQEKKPVQSEEKPTDDEEKSKEEDEEDDDEGTYTINTAPVTQQDIHTPPVKAKPSECKTPCLEDYGLSSFTLNMMHKGGAYTSQPPPPNFSNIGNVNSQVNMSRYESEESPTPISFKHNGLLVTPSLLGGRSMPAQTPDCTRTGLPRFNNFMEDSPSQQNNKIPFPHPQARLVCPFTDTGSPLPPVLHTPGAKQINKQLYQEGKKEEKKEDFDSPIPPLLMTPGVKQISKHISPPKPHVVKTAPDNDSPAVPIMMTPGSKQIQKTLNTKPPSPPPMSRSMSIWDQEPEVPEFTMSLQDITQLTQSFRLNQSSVPVPVTHSERLHDRVTPPMPELLSTKLAQIEAESNPNAKGGNSLTTSAFNTPPPPTLLGRYGFMSKYSQENIPPYGQ